MRILVPVAAVVLLAASASAQPSPTWVRTYNGPADSTDAAVAVTLDPRGDILVGGTSVGADSSRDWVVIKYTSGSDTVWVERYGGPNTADDQLHALCTDADGNCYATGRSYRAGPGYDAVTVKLAPNGETLWTRTHDGSYHAVDYGMAIAADRTGSIYVAGGSQTSMFNFACLTVKYTPAGETAWVRLHTSPDWSYANALAVDDSGNAIAVGAHDEERLLVIKYAPDGSVVWERSFSRAPGDYYEAYAVQTDPAGNVYVAGEGGVSGNSDMVAIKYTPAGETAWVRAYDGALHQSDAADALALDSAGNVCITGRGSEVAFRSDLTTVKYSASGDELWVRHHAGSSDGQDEALAVGADSRGDFIVAGRCANTSSGDDVVLLEYGPAGDSVWAAVYDDPDHGGDEPAALALNNTGSIYVTGQARITGPQGVDFLTLRYDPSGGVEETPDRPTGDAPSYAEVRTANRGPTVVPGVLMLPQAQSRWLQATRLLDVNGRRVLDLHPGASDVRRLSPGIYFVRKAAEPEYSATDVTRVIITR